MKRVKLLFSWTNVADPLKSFIPSDSFAEEEAGELKVLQKLPLSGNWFWVENDVECIFDFRPLLGKYGRSLEILYFLEHIFIKKVDFNGRQHFFTKMTFFQTPQILQSQGGNILKTETFIH